ncbi:MAG: SMP-30/gluconolactonase/LRE family protein [Planctomycetes bacterium]|nr:SMP-30/gluconolactonase/LRE family protein [Planctomycetota bacterium]
MVRSICVLSLVVALIAAGSLTVAQDQPIAGIGPAGPIVKLHTGFTFTEGPAADAEGNVYFTDVRANRIHRVTPDGQLSTLLENSEGCNGLMFDNRGRLIACQGGLARVVAIDAASKQITVLADKFEGKPFNRPNDLVVDSQGGVYFTDPNEQSVYYIAPQGGVARVAGNLARPNGVLLSPDEKTLYVLPSGAPHVLAFAIQSPGRVGEQRVLAELVQPQSGPPRGGDGLTVDTRGNLYCTQPGVSALQVISPEGKTLGLIRFPEAPANCAFGGTDMKTLYVTARTSLYTAKMEATGHRFGGK